MAWVAGLMEADGCFSLRGHARLDNTDEDVVRRVAAFLGIGRVNGPYPRPNPRHKPLWVWQVSRWQHLRPFLEHIRPWLLARRGERVDEILRRLAAKEIRSVGPGVV